MSPFAVSKLQRGTVPYGLAAAWLSLAVIAVSDAPAAPAESARPLPNAHAHNDYEHPRPLLDALDHGFCSVEADVYLVDGQLLVAHDRVDVSAERTLQALYLDPLKERVANRGGVFGRESPSLTLLIDIKSEGAETFAVLRELLSQYADMLTVVEDDRIEQKAVTIVISGNRPVQEIAAMNPRYAAMDGRLADLGGDVPSHFMPLVSDHWLRHFRWQGDGPMPEEEQRQLRKFVRQAHQEQRQVRFWATPEDPAVWAELLDAGVDFIGTDELEKLSAFLNSRPD